MHAPRKRQIDKEQFNMLLANAIYTKMNGNLSLPERKYAASLCTQLCLKNTFKGYIISDAVSAASDYVVQQLKRFRIAHPAPLVKQPAPPPRKVATVSILDAANPVKPGQELDIHEVLKSMIGTADGTDEGTDGTGSTGNTNTNDANKENRQDINVTGLIGIDSLYAINLLINPSALEIVKDVPLNTDFRVTSGDLSTGVVDFKWYVSDSRNVQTGYVNVLGGLKNVISMTIFQPRVHYLAGMDTTAKRVSIGVKELASQSIIGENGFRYHFLFRPVLRPIARAPAETQVELYIDDYGDGEYKFTKPITSLESITLNFGDPLEILTFPLAFEQMHFTLRFVCLKDK